MPAYDYRCLGCDEIFEIVRPFSNNDAVCCPACGSPAKRVFTPVGVVFKGSGFHNTDYRPRPKETDGSAAAKDSATAPTAAPACPAAKDSSAGCAGCPAAATD
jgi:putative FmdB family regulatory protein